MNIFHLCTLYSFDIFILAYHVIFYKRKNEKFYRKSARRFHFLAGFVLRKGAGKKKDLKFPLFNLLNL
ncbi:MAG TPA: hypothetical protein DEV87_06725 [Clostridiales bacterium]|nr:hypothetical protein [Clostridiales bacterium]